MEKIEQAIKCPECGSEHIRCHMIRTFIKKDGSVYIPPGDDAFTCDNCNHRFGFPEEKTVDTEAEA